jgi:glucan 1,3-beta-glucosidase
LAVVIPLYFAVIKPKSNRDGTTKNENDTASKPTETSKPDKPQTRVVTGGDGSEITMEDGTKYTYQNPYGGYWYYDEEDPFNNGARAQSWTPALNETFNYGIDKIRG